MNHEQLAHVAGVPHKIKRFNAQILQRLDHIFLFQFILSFKVELKEQVVEATQLLHQIKSGNRLDFLKHR